MAEEFVLGFFFKLHRYFMHHMNMLSALNQNESDVQGKLATGILCQVNCAGLLK